VKTKKALNPKFENFQNSLIELIIFLISEGHAKNFTGAQRLCGFIK
jgi:hypothetical protein